MDQKQEPLLDVSEARNRLLNKSTPVGIEEIDLQYTLDRIVAEDIVALFDYPSFANSAMDGFAVRSVDVREAGELNPVLLRVIGDIPAGTSTPPILGPGQAARIMTGAMLPPGADAVIPIENTDHFQVESLDRTPEATKVFRSVKAGEFVRPVGQDVKKGQLLLGKGRKIGPAQLGLCSLFGIRRVSTWKKPKVAIISSGDEIIPPGDDLLPGKVYDANNLMLKSLVEICGGEALSLGIVPDQKQQVQARMDEAVSLGVDLIISSAGVSVGAFDYMRMVVEENGQIDFWKVNMRPGKPLVSGTYQGIPYLGLPGNPVSAFIGFLVFVEPMIKKMTGNVNLFRDEILVQVKEDIYSDGRQSFLRAYVYEDNGIRVGALLGHQGSGDIYSLAQANTLLIIPSGVKSVRSGEVVKAWSLGE
jgi:molybdopterin molybdotransferase